jgi:hypothetical protein
LIEVVRFKLERDTEEYFKTVKNLSRARAAMLKGEPITQEQDDALWKVRRILDPEIDRILERLTSPTEIARNYDKEDHKWL